MTRLDREHETSTEIDLDAVKLSGGRENLCTGVVSSFSR